MIGSVYDTAVYGTGLYDDPPSPGMPYVELFLNGAWVNITSYVLVSAGIQITRGKQDESSAPSPASCRMSLFNADGRFSPRNASGAYYGYIGRNTPLRVSVYDAVGALNIRFWGDVIEWPVSWDPTGRQVVTQITAAGLRRQAAFATPIISSYTNSMLHDPAITGLIGFWPMEDGDQATTFASALAGGPASGTMTSISPASDDTFKAMAPLPVFGDGSTVSFSFQGALTAAQTVRMFAKVTGAAGGMLWRLDTSGAHYFLVEYAPATGAIAMAMYNYASGVQEYLMSFASGTWGGAGDMAVGGRFSIEMRQNGADTEYNILCYPPGAAVAHQTGVNTITSTTLGGVVGVTLFTDPANGATAVIGGLSVQATTSIPSIFDLNVKVIAAYSGERAADRASRLSTAAGIAYGLTGTASSTALMGAQPIDDFLTVFDQCAASDGGLSTESVSSRSLRFRTRSDMYDQNANALTLPYTSATVNQLVPVDDDQNLANDVTVVRINGGSARRTDTTSAVGTAAVGTYAVEYDLSLASDAQCADQANWRLALGTVNKPRVPEVGLDWVVQTFLGVQAKVLTMREGDQITLTNVPAFTGLESTTRLRILGWTETIGDNEYQFDFNCVNIGPFGEVFILDDTVYGILDTDRLGI